MKQLTFLSFLLVFGSSILAQEAASGSGSTVTGILTDPVGEPQAFGNAVLYRAADTTFVSGATTDTDGAFTLSTAATGRFFVRLSALGFADADSEVFTLAASALDLGTLSVGDAGVDLETVTVTTEKPLYERRIDRTVVNLEGRPTVAGSTVLDVTERLPGVIVNRQGGGINILGKDGVNVMINGRRQYLNGDALLAYLDGMPADNIVSIEIITTPPANMDADGNAGFLNIILKDIPGEGLQGRYTLGAGYGNGETADASLNLDYRRGKVAATLSASFVHTGQGEYSDLTRTAEGAFTSVVNERDPSAQVGNLRLGIDYEIGPSTVVGAGVSGFVRNWDMVATNEIVYSPDTLIDGTIDEYNLWRNVQTNLNLSHTFAGGNVITADFDYLYFKNDNPTTFDYDYFLGGDRLAEADIDLLSDKTTPFGIAVGRLDLKVPLSGEAEFSTGVKLVDSYFDNDVVVARNGIDLPSFTGLSELTERVYAAYTQLDYPISERLSIKAGLRYEYSDTRLDTEDERGLVDRRFGELFPTLYLRYGKLNLSYGRRINRPSFSAMAPFLIFIDPRTNFGGNPALQPSISNNVEASLQLGTVNLSAQYATEDSTLVGFQNRYDPTTDTQVIIPDNLRRQRTASFSAGSPIPLGERWTARGFATLIWQETESVINDGSLQRIDQTNLRFNGSIGYDFGSEWNAEASGFYQGGSLSGNNRILPLGIANFGLTKGFPNGSRIGLNVTDAFETLVFRSKTSVPRQDFEVARTFDFSNRTVLLSYSANFGGGRVRSARQRRAVEEAGRVN